MNRRGGIIHVRVNGVGYQAKGNFTFALGTPKREALIASDGTVIGYKETANIPYIEGELYDGPEVDLEALMRVDDATATLELANGKTFVLRNAWYAGDSTVQTEEGNIKYRMEGRSGEMI